jgi:lactose/L-arabinose transport system permease protein
VKSHVLKAAKGYGTTALLGALMLIFIGPLVFMLIWSTWDYRGIFQWPPRLSFGPFLLENARYLLSTQKTAFVYGIYNSMIISSVNTIMAVFFCSLSGFAFAKYQFKGKRVLFFLLLGTMMIPYQITLIPLFIIMARLHWVNTYWAVIVPTIANAFGVFLMRNSIFATIPDELLDAARIDGVSEYGLYFKVLLPLLLPTLAAFSTITFMANWNSFVWPIIILRSKEMQVFTTALATMINTFPTAGLKSEWPYGASILGSTISMIPPVILFFALQKHFIKGILTGAIK